ncbi:Putative ribonuclease H protein At1g65750 [Linum grandiflorum]
MRKRKRKNKEVVCGTSQLTISEVKISRHSPSVFHLFFADDSFVFLEASEESTSHLKSILNNYQFLLGQKDKYLGIPSLILRCKKDMFKFLEDKFRKTISRWKGACLSPAGKETLIKSIAFSFPIHAMTCFKLPRDIYKKFDRLISNFWWGNSSTSKPIHWTSWHSLSKSKLHGGMGFRNFETLNQALLAKQGWSLFNRSNNLAAKIFQREILSQLLVHSCYNWPQSVLDLAESSLWG